MDRSNHQHEFHLFSFSVVHRNNIFTRKVNIINLRLYDLLRLPEKTLLSWKNWIIICFRSLSWANALIIIDLWIFHRKLTSVVIFHANLTCFCWILPHDTSYNKTKLTLLVLLTQFYVAISLICLRSNHIHIMSYCHVIQSIGLHTRATWKQLNTNFRTERFVPAFAQISLTCSAMSSSHPTTTNDACFTHVLNGSNLAAADEHDIISKICFIFLNSINWLTE